jgi:hypothetical protein
MSVARLGATTDPTPGLSRAERSRLRSDSGRADPRRGSDWSAPDDVGLTPEITLLYYAVMARFRAFKAPVRQQQRPPTRDLQLLEEPLE